MADSKDFAQLQADYDRLTDSLPYLPPKETFYLKFKDVCLKVHALVNPITKLETQIETFRRDKQCWNQKTLYRELLQETAGRLQFQLLLCQSQLDTLYIYPPLMIATGAITETEWRSMMAQNVLDLDDQPVATDRAVVDQLIGTQLKKLEKCLWKLDRLEDELAEEDDEDTLNFNQQVLLHLQAIRSKVEQLERHHLQTISSRTTGIGSVDLSIGGPVDSNYHEYSDSDGETMDDPKSEDKANADVPKLVDPDDSMDLEDSSETQKREASRIQENIAFMEPLDDSDSDIITPQDLKVLFAEELVEIDEAVGDDIHEEEIQAAPEVVVQPHDEETEEELIERLRNELRQAQQAREDLRMMMRQIETDDPGARRSFLRRRIRNEDERTMPCVFCKVRGDHYSDSCITYITTRERREILAREGRCGACLDWWCDGGPLCRKRNARCRYCGETGHNACICDLPDRTKRREDRLENLRRDLENSTTRVLRIKRRLERHGVHDA
ncbi:hypothetical protein COOONC_01655 [Cooperia oncophora]